MVRQRIVTAMATVLLLCLTGCPELQQTARDTIAASRGVLDAAGLQFQAECQSDPGLAKCKTVRRGEQAHEVAISALNIYCAGPGWETGGECEPQSGAEEKLKAAIRDLTKVKAEVEALLR